MLRMRDCHCGDVSLRNELSAARFWGAEDVRAASCSSDPLQCGPGDLYVALLDEQGNDGHDAIELAVRRGASAVLAERPLAVGVPQCIVPDTRVAYSQLCHALAGHPSRDLQVIGVCGTNGKTTTSLLIASILAAAEQAVAVAGTPLPSRQAQAHLPGSFTPAQLASWLHDVHHQRGDSVVIELSSLQLAGRLAAGLELDAAVMTNLRRDPLGRHGSLRNYFAAQQRVFKYLKPGGFAVLNADDPGSNRLTSQLDCPAITVGVHSGAEVTAVVVERFASEQTFLLSAGNETAAVRTRMIGDHHVGNCLAASAVGLVLGIPLTTIARGLETVDHLPARLQRIECGQPFQVFVDLAATPDRMTVCLRALRKAVAGRVICVYGAAPHAAAEDRPLLGRVVEQGADVGVITGPTARCRQLLPAAHDILDGYERPARAHLIPSRRRAIEWALAAAEPGDAVLLAACDENQMDADCDSATAYNWLYAEDPETMIAGVIRP